MAYLAVIIRQREQIYSRGDTACELISIALRRCIKVVAHVLLLEAPFIFGEGGGLF